MNMLKCNPEKTDFIYFSSKFKPCSRIPNLSVESHQIVPSDTILNLGVRFDKHFLFKDRISDICRSASLSLSRISKIRSYLYVTTAERLVHAFVTAKLDYCNSLLCDLPKCQLSRLQEIQNTAARIVTLTKKRQHIAPILRNLHWLTIEKRIHYKVSIITFNILNNSCPIYQKNLIRPLHYMRNLRSTNLNCVCLYQPRSRLKNLWR